MRSLRLVPYWSVHETLGVDAHNAPLKMRTRRIHLSRAVAWSCVRRHPVAGAALGSTDVEGSDPPFGMPGTASGRVDMCTHLPPSPAGSLPARYPSGKGFSTPLPGGGSPSSPTVQPVCRRYREGPGRGAGDRADRGRHGSSYRDSGDLGFREDQVSEDISRPQRPNSSPNSWDSEVRRSALSVGEIAAYVDAAFASIATAPEDKCFSRLIGRGGV